MVLWLMIATDTQVKRECREFWSVVVFLEVVVVMAVMSHQMSVQ